MHAMQAINALANISSSVVWKFIFMAALLSFIPQVAFSKDVWELRKYKDDFTDQELLTAITMKPANRGIGVLSVVCYKDRKNIAISYSSGRFVEPRVGKITGIKYRVDSNPADSIFNAVVLDYESVWVMLSGKKPNSVAQKNPPSPPSPVKLILTGKKPHSVTENNPKVYPAPRFLFDGDDSQRDDTKARKMLREMLNGSEILLEASGGRVKFSLDGARNPLMTVLDACGVEL